MTRDDSWRKIAVLLKETGRIEDRADKADFIAHLADEIPGYGRRFGTLAQITCEDIVGNVRDNDAWPALLKVIEHNPAFPANDPDVIALRMGIEEQQAKDDARKEAVRRLKFATEEEPLGGWLACYFIAAGLGATYPPPAESEALALILAENRGGGVACEFVERLRRLMPAERQSDFARTSEEIAELLRVSRERFARIRADVDRSPVDARLFISILVRAERHLGLEAYWSWRPVNGTDPDAGYDDGNGFNFLTSIDTLDSTDLVKRLAELLQNPPSEDEPIKTLVRLFQEPERYRGPRPIFEVIVSDPAELELRFDDAELPSGKRLGTVAPVVVRPPAAPGRTTTVLKRRLSRWRDLATSGAYAHDCVRRLRRHEIATAATLIDESRWLGLAFNCRPSMQNVTDLMSVGFPVVFWARNGEVVATRLKGRMDELPDTLFRDAKTGKFVLVWDNPFWEMADETERAS